MGEMFWNNAPTSYLGRNGLFKCKGFGVRRYRYVTTNSEFDVIRIYPITSRGRLGRCFIEVPIGQVKRFTELLKQARRKEERR